MRIKLPLSLTNFTHEKFANHSESPRLAFKIFIVSPQHPAWFTIPVTTRSRLASPLKLYRVPPTSRVVYYTSKLLESVAVLNLLI